MWENISWPPSHSNRVDFSIYWHFVVLERARFSRETSQNLTKVLKATSLFRIEYEGDSKLQKCLSQHRIACILVLFLTVHHAFSSVRTYTLVRIVNKYLRCLKAVKLDFGKTTTEKIGFYFLTYELNQRRIPLVKMVNGVEEVLILLFVAFEYEYLFWKFRLTRLNSELWCTCFITKTEVLFFLVCALDRDFWERIFSLNSHVSLFYLLFYSLFYIHVVVVVVIYSGKDSYPKDTRKKKEDGKPKIWLADLACWRKDDWKQ